MPSLSDSKSNHSSVKYVHLPPEALEYIEYLNKKNKEQKESEFGIAPNVTVQTTNWTPSTFGSDSDERSDIGTVSSDTNEDLEQEQDDNDKKPNSESVPQQQQETKIKFKCNSNTKSDSTVTTAISLKQFRTLLLKYRTVLTEKERVLISKQDRINLGVKLKDKIIDEIDDIILDEEEKNEKAKSQSQSQYPDYLNPDVVNWNNVDSIEKVRIIMEDFETEIEKVKEIIESQKKEQSNSESDLDCGITVDEVIQGYNEEVKIEQRNVKKDIDNDDDNHDQDIDPIDNEDTFLPDTLYNLQSILKLKSDQSLRLSSGLENLETAVDVVVSEKFGNMRNINTEPGPGPANKVDYNPLSLISDKNFHYFLRTFRGPAVEVLESLKEEILPRDSDFHPDNEFTLADSEFESESILDRIKNIINKEVIEADNNYGIMMKRKMEEIQRNLKNRILELQQHKRDQSKLLKLRMKSESGHQSEINWKDYYSVFLSFLLGMVASLWILFEKYEDFLGNENEPC